MCIMKVEIPGTEEYLVPGVRVKLRRFDNITWIVQYGWFSWGGNRPMYGWYLINTSNTDEVKPLQKPDLDDIYIIE